MLIFAIILFALALFLGIYLLTFVLAEKNTPKGLAIIHGSIAAIGIITLLIYSIFYRSPVASILVLILAALGGIYLFARDIFGNKLPKALAVGHGLIAFIGFLLLIVFAVSLIGVKGYA